MDMSYARCFPELGIDDSNNLLHLMQNDEYRDSLDNSTTITTQQLLLNSMGENKHHQPLSSENFQMGSVGIPTKHPKSTNLGQPQTDSQQFYTGWLMKPKNEEILYNNEVLLSFPSFNWKADNSYDKRNHSTRYGRDIKIRGSSWLTESTPPPTKDHIMAERKRREKIRQRLIALSAIVPGLKKMDKASVLENATKYLKHLEESIKGLEEQLKKKKSLESVVLVKKSHIHGGDDDDDDDSGGENSHEMISSEGLPEIEARIMGKSVLIRIHCEKHKCVLPKVLDEVEKLNLTIVNTSALPFGDYAMDITILAQTETEFSLTQKDFIRILRLAFVGLTDNYS